MALHANYLQQQVAGRAHATSLARRRTQIKPPGPTPTSPRRSQRRGRASRTSPARPRCTSGSNVDGTALRRSSSSPSTSRSMAQLATSITIRSPSATKAIGPPIDRLGGDVSDAEAVSAAGEPPIGHERAVPATTRTLHRAGHGQHLAHARTALRTLVADHDDGARLDRVRRGSPPSPPSSPSKTLARPSKVDRVEARDLDDGPLWSERPTEDRDAAAARGSVGRAAGTTSPSGSGGSRSARFSAIVLPVTVTQSPCSRPASRSWRRTTGTPPIRSRSVMWNRPCGFMSATCATRSAIRLKSSSSSSTRASCAMARRCSTALVEPPSAITTAMAFSNASLGHDVAWRDAAPKQLDDLAARLEGEVVASGIDRRGGC